MGIVASNVEDHQRRDAAKSAGRPGCAQLLYTRTGDQLLSPEVSRDEISWFG